MYHDYDSALNDFNKSLEIEPNNAFAWKKRGDVYRMLEKYDKALYDFNKSLAL